MPKEIRNAVIPYISIVKQGASKKEFAIIKNMLSQGEEEINKEFTILKTNDEQRLVTGVVYEPNVVDAHGEYMTEAEIEKAAHNYMEYFRKGDADHSFEEGAGVPVESYVAKSDHQVGEQVVRKGSWVVTMKVQDDDVWEGIKKGEYNSFSMAGKGEKVEVSKEDEGGKENNHEDTASIVKQVFQSMKEFFTGKGASEAPVEKESRVLSEINLASLIDSYMELGSVLQRATGVRPYADGFYEQYKGYMSDHVLDDARSEFYKNDDKEESELTKEELQNIFKEQLNPIVERLDAVEKEAGIKKEEEGEGDNTCSQCGSTVQKSTEGTEATQKGDSQEGQGITLDDVKKAFREEIQPLEERLQTVEKAKGIRKSEKEDKTKSEVNKNRSMWQGVL